MGYRRIAVHLDNTERSEARMRLASGLASRFSARLLGFFAECDPYLANLASRLPAEMFRKSGGDAEQAFRAEARRQGIDVDWGLVAVRRDSALTDALVAQCRLVDIAILGQFQPEAPGMADSGVPSDLAERVVLRAGRPLLVIPYAGAHTEIGRRILVAWNGGREAARALNDALPFLTQADEVIITAIVPVDQERPANDDICAGVAHYLRAHGIDAKTEVRVSEKGRTMEMLLSSVVDQGADLLVVGAHGNYCAPDLPQGSGTKYILGNMTVPVLMSY